MNTELYTCPCCGYKTLEECPPGTFEICRWEDDNVQFEDPFYKGGANEVCLYEAQRNFVKYGASDELFIDSVRKPTTNDQRDCHFKLNEHYFQMRGLSFEIPNGYGQYLFDILNAFDFKQYVWKTGGEEAYYIENGELGTPLFPKPHVYAGDEFYKTISEKDYYVIFADLKAFPDPSYVKDITTYEEFLNSRCEFVLLLVDCAYVTIYTKNPEVITAIYTKAITSQYENVAYITDENDSRTTLVAF